MTALPRSTPSAEGVDARGILSFLDAVEHAPSVEMHSLMLLRHGAVVAEGWWAPYSPESPHLLYSLSKSFTSTALGFAVAEGLVGLDDTVLSHFPELDDEITDPRSRRLRVRHVAAMASGHLAETVERARDLGDGDLVRGLLLLPPEREPGSVFAYNQPCTFAVGAIVQRAAGMPLTEYLRPRLLEPLGISPDGVGWLTDPYGRELGFSGLHAPTDAVAKLGQFYLRRGEWDGIALLSDAWVDDATRVHIDNPAEENPDWSQGYGFQFWRARHGYRGDGAFGQFCVILPEQDAVLAITGQSEDMQAVLTAAWEHLLPAMAADAIGIGEAEDAAEAERLLAVRLSGAALASTTGGPVEGARRAFLPGPDNRIPALTRVVVEPAASGARLELHEGDAVLHATAGADDWIVADALAASGGTGPAGLVFDILFVETPHRLRLVCDDGRFAASWVTAPLHPVALAEMRMPR